jgi:hypothetical protein
MKYSLLLIPLLLLPNLAYAKRWYNVEVIIFSYTSDTGVQEEYWPQETGLPDNRHTVSLIGRDSGITRLPGQVTEYESLSFNKLAGTLNRLRNSSRYNVIYSRAWRLPDLPSRSAPAVRIKAGQRSANNSDLTGTLEGGVIDDAVYEIDGRIKISLSKYLDVDADLIYRRTVNLPDANGLPVNELRQFRLKEFRRMKSKTIHYLDHPLFGVVIGIDRYYPNGAEKAAAPEIIQPKSASDINN